MNDGALLWYFVVGTVVIAVVVGALVAVLIATQRQRLALLKENAARVHRAHEEERAWVAAELHDDALQRVGLLRHELEDTWAELPPGMAPELGKRLGAIQEELADLAMMLRGVARRLHPTIVDQAGLADALRSLVDEMAAAGGVRVEATIPATLAVAPDVARAAYRIAQESLRNVARHSGSPVARLAVTDHDDAIVVSVEDDGRGFDPDARPASGGIGVLSVRERALGVNGSISIDSAPGRGTRIVATLPRSGV